MLSNSSLNVNTLAYTMLSISGLHADTLGDIMSVIQNIGQYYEYKWN